MQVSIQHFPEYAVVRVSGAPTLGEFLAFIAQLGEDSAGWPQGKLLVDLRGVVTITSFTDQFAVGEEAGRRLKHLRKVASVVPPERITRTSEKAARHTGAEVRMFGAESEAVRWLLEPA